MNNNSPMRCGALIISIVAISLLIFGVILSFQKTDYFPKPNEAVIYYSEQSIPSIYTISDIYDTPSYNFNNSWIGSLIYYFESLYRFFGIQTGYLNNNEYLKFSSIFLEETFKKFYKNINKNLPEIYSSSIIYFLLKNNSLLKKLLIPYFYYDSIENNIEYEQKVNNNPISFEITNINYAKSIMDIKYLIYESEKPLLLTVFQPKVNYINNNSNILSFKSELPSNDFFLSKSPSFTTYENPLTFFLVGWSDDHTIIIGKEKQDIIKSSIGGFIIKNPLNSNGNLINFYEGKISNLLNHNFCLKNNLTNEWIGLNYQCFLENKNISNCRNSTLLICKNENYCNLSNFYYLFEDNNFNKLYLKNKNGLIFPKMLEFYNNSNFFIKDFNNIPFHSIHEFFEPFNIKKNEILNRCGYSFFPFDLIQDQIKSGYLVHGVSIGVKWSKDSFSRNSNFKWTQEMLNSILKFEENFIR